MSLPSSPLAPPRRDRRSSGREHVVVGLSGGVDSAVSTLLLKRSGYRVSALFMKNWEEDDGEGYCAAAADLRDAEKVCNDLGVPLHTVNLSGEYWEDVFERCLGEFRAGRTPNPDVLCNQHIKFHAFREHARRLGGDRIATGHYARIHVEAGKSRLYKASDREKDQTYFLHRLDQAQLEHAMFPLAGLNKAEVRGIARTHGLSPHDKPDSTGLCFIGERRFGLFLGRFIGASPGVIESVEGKALGTHRGLAFYTIGQRQGLGIGGRRDAGPQPWYVAAKDHERNVLLVVQGRLHRRLYHSRLVATDAHWIAQAPGASPTRCGAKIRYRQSDQRCEIRMLGPERVEVCFDHPQWAVAPGQSIVFYRGSECLGGAIISHAGERA